MRKHHKKSGVEESQVCFTLKCSTTLLMVMFQLNIGPNLNRRARSTCLLGMMKKTKAYMLFNPIIKKAIMIRDFQID